MREEGDEGEGVVAGAGEGTVDVVGCAPDARDAGFVVAEAVFEA